MLRDPHDAEEAVQEAFERAWRRRDACADERAQLAWLLRITHNEALRLWARRRRRLERERGGITVDPPVDDPALEEVLAAAAADQALAELAPRDRAIVRLRYLDDVPQAAVAAALGMPEMTVGVRLHRARKLLRASLERERTESPGA